MDSSKDKILAMIHERVFNVPAKVKAIEELKIWVEQNTLINSDNFAENVYSAIFQSTNICKYGNIKNFNGLINGYGGCTGGKVTCQCTKDKLADKMTSIQKTVSADERASRNKKTTETNSKLYNVAYVSQMAEVKRSISSKLTKVQTSNILPVDDISSIKVEITEYLTLCNIQYSENINHGNYVIDIICTDFNIGILIKSVSANQPRGELVTELESAQTLLPTIVITDFEWSNKNYIIKSIINSKLRLNSSIYARKCIVSKIDTTTARSFFDKNHIQGHINAKYYLGLYYNSELVMALSAGHSRFSKGYELELYRLATAANLTVVGGASKLIKALKQLESSPVVSYCDRSKSIGGVYSVVGFVLESITAPGYFWTNSSNIVSRYQSQKSKIRTSIQTYDASLSETDNMVNNGYQKFWDCGNYKFILK